MKFQIPNSKFQGKSKRQVPKMSGGVRNLELGASLELGIWNLELVLP
jgi:hypothetical protein